ncbi:MAG: Franean1_4349 family RiPP [Anaerolineae bacterium]|nr:Franean1_4349 family RiPP [Anaerolineae bacterium]
MSPDLERLVGRAVMDKAFRDKLLADPEGAVKEAGFKLTPEEMSNLKAGVEQIKHEAASKYFDQQLVDTLKGW